MYKPDTLAYFVRVSMFTDKSLIALTPARCKSWFQSCPCRLCSEQPQRCWGHSTASHWPETRQGHSMEQHVLDTNAGKQLSLAGTDV